jgi:hypothetical protein
MLQGRIVTHMNGGKYIPPNHTQQLTDDLLDIAEARETESLKDVLIRLARQKKSGSIVLDGRRSTPSCRWSTFSSTVQTAPG